MHNKPERMGLLLLFHLKDEKAEAQSGQGSRPVTRPGKGWGQDKVPGCLVPESTL